MASATPRFTGAQGVDRPSVEVPINYVTLKRHRDECYLWIVPKCVICGKRHTHGGGSLDGDPRRLLGHRSPHCDPRGKHTPRGYMIVEMPARPA